MNSQMSRAGQGFTCHEVIRLVTDYLDQVMPATDRARFEAHLQGCDGCDGYLEQIRTAIRVTGHVPPETLPPEARERLLDAFREWKTAEPAKAGRNGWLPGKLRQLFKR